MSLYAFREMRESDHAVVYRTWLRTFVHSRWVRESYADARDFYAAHHRVVERLLERAHGIVAHVPDDEDTVLAWLVYEPADVVHYLFVKSAFRGYGVSRALVTTALGDDAFSRPVRYTHESPDVLRQKLVPQAWVKAYGAVDGPILR